VQLDSRDTVKSLVPSPQAVGIDLGLKYFLADSKENVEHDPRFYRKGKKKLNRLIGGFLRYRVLKHPRKVGIFEAWGVRFSGWVGAILLS
jgi:transposase